MPPAAEPEPGASHRWVALLGQRDQPTDALFDYAQLLAKALRPQGYDLDVVHFDWANLGWNSAWKSFSPHLKTLPEAEWVLVQYSHLAWSRRGYPLRLPWLVRHLQRQGVRVAVVFHDPGPFGGTRLRDALRRRAQVWAMRRAAHLADRAISTISPECVPWMREPSLIGKVISIPAGSNLPSQIRASDELRSGLPIVAVFGVTENGAENSLLAFVVERVAQDYGAFRLVLFGRGSAAAADILRPTLAGSSVQLESHGLLPPEWGAALLAQADVQLFLRGGLSSRRGSAIAGICCGLPIVAFTGVETAPPISEAGVRLAPSGDEEGLARELVTVLRDKTLRESLRQRSIAAAQRYFSWESIADQYVAAIES